MNCDLRCRKATVDAELVRKLATFAKVRPKVWLLLNIGSGWFIQMDGEKEKIKENEE
jgi:hypothetical protein